MKALVYIFFTIFCLFLSFLSCIKTKINLDSKYIIENGKSNTEIIIDAKSPRTVELAAIDLQLYLKEITGVEIPISSITQKKIPYKLFIGRSAYTDSLGINIKDIKDDGYKIQSGENWMVMIGADDEYTPPQKLSSYAKKSQALKNRQTTKEKEKWENPLEGLYNNYNRELDIWSFDKQGSFNAVNEFLRIQGVRWYMPGNIGTVIPRKNKVDLPKINHTYKPEFSYRKFFIIGASYGDASKDEVMWQLHLGLNAAQKNYGVGEKSHGLHNILSTTDSKRNKDMYALYAGKRATDREMPCLSSNELLNKTIKYAENIFDSYGEPMVSVMPPDGYVKICECNLCKDKDTPERGYDGSMSDYVWEFVNKVGAELYKSHPDRKIICIAYGPYRLPPNKIAKLSPNIVVGISQRRSSLVEKEYEQLYTDIKNGWIQKTSNKIIIRDHYRSNNFRGDDFGVPVVFPHIIEKDLKQLKGNSTGEFVEIYKQIKPKLESFQDLAISHLNIYLTARMYWDVDQSIDDLLNDYYEKFFGPASKQMKEFFEIAENNWNTLEQDKASIEKLFKVAEEGKKITGESIYGERIKLILAYIKPLQFIQNKNLIFNDKKNSIKIYPKSEDELTFDGKLDDPFWNDKIHMPIYTLKQKNNSDALTTFMIGRTNKAIYFGITCLNNQHALLKNTSEYEKESDKVEILIITQSGANKNISINNGNINLKPNVTNPNIFFVYKGDNYWSIEYKIPIIKGIATDKTDIAEMLPTEKFPWYFNIIRSIENKNFKSETSYSTPEKKHFRDINWFTKLYTKK
ncbi:MAG: DUF4838 domain-containing protein [Bacteroidetes bacterium]|nr:DUF4838 domain-containing protein [Bacteroidota bacterium]